MNHADLYHCFTVVRSFLAVLAQTPAPRQPNNGALHHPALRQHLEPPLMFCTLDHLNAIANILIDPIVQRVVVIATIAVDDTQTWKRFGIHLGQDILGCNTVVHACRRDQHRQQQTQRIHNQMPLSTFDFLAGIVAAFFAALLGGFYRLAVDGRDAWMKVASRLFAHVGTQTSEDLIPDAMLGPVGEVVVDGFPWRKLMRDHAPLATGPYQIKARVDDFAQIRRAWSAAGFGTRQEFGDELP